MISVMKRNKFPVIIAFVYILLLIIQTDKGIQAIDNSVYYLVEMIEIMPVIFLLTVSIEVLIPKKWIIKHFGDKSGLFGNVLSLILGSISAGPIYAAFPICKSLVSKGASVNNVVIILSSWAVVKVPMLANEAKFLGPEFMGVRWVLTVIAIFVMGYIMNFIVKKSDIPTEKQEYKKGLVIKKDYCVGCGICAKLIPEVYTIQSGKAEIISSDGLESLDRSESIKIRDSVDKCPVKAIVYSE